MARNTTTPALVPARVIFTGRFGKVDDVVTLPQAEIDDGVATGDLDAHPDAVAYAQGLAKAAAQVEAQA